MSWKSRGSETSLRSVLSRRLTILLCIGCFCAGMLFTDRFVSSVFLEFPLFDLKSECRYYSFTEILC